MVALTKPGGERGLVSREEGSVQCGDDAAVDGPAVEPHLQLGPGHRDGQAVPGVVRQSEWEGLHPRTQLRPGGGVVEPEHVLPAAGLDLEVPDRQQLSLPSLTAATHLLVWYLP